MTEIEQWDLTTAMSPYLDRHMVFPLLEYLDTLIDDGVINYPKKDIAAARLSLLGPTHMVDYAIEKYKDLHGAGTVPKEMEEQRETVLEKLEALRAGCKPLDDICSNTEERARLTAIGQWSLGGLAGQPRSKITPEVVETYRSLAKYNFECGDYKTAKEMLENYISLFASPPKKTNQDDDDDLNPNAPQQQQQKDDNVGNSSIYYLKSVSMDMLEVLWGKLACDIMVQDYDAASAAVTAVKLGLESLVSSKEISPLKALQQRTWLLHWSLFAYWNAGGLEHMVDLFHSERYKQAITTNAPHLLRYLTAAVLLCKRRVTKKAAAGSNAEARRLMKNLINVMQDSEYSDPIVEFVNCLCVKFDFDSAQTKLAECEAVLKADFFLCKQTALFMEEARVFVFENYCRIHNKIDLKALGEKLAMDQDQAERWIVDLIRNADLDAKIDSEEGCVVMGANSQSIYAQVMERTRDLNVRSATLSQNLATFLNEAKKEKAKKEKAAREQNY
mmetsp:Transcript_16769/g.24292  ORF Transcript_16769/g.24292 Transcript_16769/m.24292 type:complete len:502 (+) Transcript_16769:72-1577(+)